MRVVHLARPDGQRLERRRLARPRGARHHDEAATTRAASVTILDVGFSFSPSLFVPILEGRTELQELQLLFRQSHSRSHRLVYTVAISGRVSFNQKVVEPLPSRHRSLVGFELVGSSHWSNRFKDVKRVCTRAVLIRDSKHEGLKDE